MFYSCVNINISSPSTFDQTCRSMLKSSIPLPIYTPPDIVAFIVTSTVSVDLAETASVLF